MMSHSGSRSRPAGSPAETARLAATVAVRSAILTYFALVVIETYVAAKGSYRKVCLHRYCFGRAGALSWVGETYRVFVRDAKAATTLKHFCRIAVGRSLEEERPWINPTTGSTA